MIRHLTTALNVPHGDAARDVFGFGEMQVLGRRIAPEGQDWIMLKRQKGVDPSSFNPLCHQLPLQEVRVVVRHPPQPACRYLSLHLLHTLSVAVSLRPALCSPPTRE